MSSKKILVLLAGYPGTGKSYFSNIIQNYYKFFKVISPDEIKEEYWDKYGFNNLEEKEKLVKESWNEYYKRLERYLKNNESVISDYPFSNKQKKYLEALVEKYNYKAVTVRMMADIDKLYERQKLRDLSSDRHLGHILTKYKKNIKIENRSEAEGLLTYEEFQNRCLTRGYDKFELGKLIELDMSNFSKLDYLEIISKIFS